MSYIYCKLLPFLSMHRKSKANTSSILLVLLALYLQFSYYLQILSNVPVNMLYFVHFVQYYEKIILGCET